MCEAAWLQGGYGRSGGLHAASVVAKELNAHVELAHQLPACGKVSGRTAALQKVAFGELACLSKVQGQSTENKAI